MSHVRQDTYTATGERARHLRKFGKRRTARAERRNARRMIRHDLD